MQVTSAEERFDNGFWQNEFSFLDFPTLPAKNIQPLSENFWLVCQKCKLGVQANKLWENCFERSTKLFNIFLFWAKTFRTFGTKVSADLSKMQSRGTIWRKKLFLEKSYVPSNHFWTSSQTVWKLWWKYFNTVVEFAFYVSREEFEKKSYWKRRFLFNSVTLVKALRLRAKAFH